MRFEHRTIRLVDQVANYSATQVYKGFSWFTGWFLQIRFDFITVPDCDSGISGIPLEKIVTSNLIRQNNPIIESKCFIQVGADCHQHTTELVISTVGLMVTDFAKVNTFSITALELIARAVIWNVVVYVLKHKTGCNLMNNTIYTIYEILHSGRIKTRLSLGARR